MIEPLAVARVDADCVASGISSSGLMRAAGYAVAAEVLRLWPQAGRIVVLAGPGNNGGDGYVAAGALRRSGCPVALFSLLDTGPLTADAAEALAACGLPAQPLRTYVPAAGDLVVDALFGAGLSRSLSPDVIALIARIESEAIPVVSIDIPSGICGRGGSVLGGAFRADVTVTFAAAKPGLLLLPGRAHAGRLVVADIGIPQRFIVRHASGIRVNQPSLWSGFSMPKSSSAHKYSHGALVVFSGGAGRTGAARLAAAAALAAGAGLVTIASPADAMAENAAHLTAIMLRSAEDESELAALLEDRRLAAFVIGPGFGIGDKLRHYAKALAGTGKPVVVDADAISAFRDKPDELFEAFAAEFAGSDVRLVLTPHEGEFGRLFPDLVADASLSKVDRAQAAAARANAVVIYKGADTAIASPAGHASINTNAPPWLATAGSGDALAGLCGSLLAQGYPAYEAACAAVWHHGEAGAQAGKGLTAETLINFIDI